jgi:hypothetical protein
VARLAVVGFITIVILYAAIFLAKIVLDIIEIYRARKRLRDVEKRVNDAKERFDRFMRLK